MSTAGAWPDRASSRSAQICRPIADETIGSTIAPVSPCDLNPHSGRAVDALADERPDATDGKLSLRFERDITPLISGLYQHAVGITQSHADAEDLLQETMFKAYKSFRTFREGTYLSAWLHRIMINTYINRYRAERRRPAQCSIDQFTVMKMAVDAQQSPTGRRSAEDQLLALLPDEDIRSAMDALPDQFRTTVYYADVEGYRYSEIAELTDAPLGTVMSRLHRGRRQLRRRLADVARQRGFDVPEEPYDATA